MNTPLWLASLDIEGPSTARAETGPAVRGRGGCRPSAFGLAVVLHMIIALAIVLIPPSAPEIQEIQVVDLVPMLPAAAAAEEPGVATAPPAASPAEDRSPPPKQPAQTQPVKPVPKPAARPQDRPRPAPAPRTASAPQSVPAEDETGAMTEPGAGTAPEPAKTASPSASSGGMAAAAFEPPRGQAGYLNNPAPTYPRVARKAGWQGLVRLLVDVAEDGRVVTVTIRRSSGFEVLDDSALAAVRDWKFRPATRGGIPTAASVEVPIRFSLSQGG